MSRFFKKNKTKKIRRKQHYSIFSVLPYRSVSAALLYPHVASAVTHGLKDKEGYKQLFSVR